MNSDILDSFSVVIPENIKDLLTKYEEHTINFESNVSKLSLAINENLFEKGRTEYDF
ncbi:hypothetical protein Glove_197g39 [Diversispora epigaea]|uniref:Uncharacterized protein n=1 Tax=Diversispora epigaea TaxID=1348612 RepID=A0A397IKF6_9GLOM|nr:hypothetical protein Glove_197g39 [Diversispora epigaea]